MALLTADPDDWVSIDLAKVMTRLVSRMASHIWFGDNPMCRDEAWLALNMEVIEDICLTALILKALPGILHPVIGPILPSRRKLWRSMDRVHSYVVPLIEERRRRQAAEGKNYEKPDDMLQWFMDDANEDEQDPTGLSMRYIFAVLGSLYLVSNAMVDILYDLTARPEYLDALRDEVRQVLAEDGGWVNGTDLKLIKMDSFMKESQRVNSPSPRTLRPSPLARRI
jgi:cytochrome P450